MRAGLTEVRNTRKATHGERWSHYVRTTAEATPSERLRNAVELQLQWRGAEQRALQAGAELRPEDGYLQLVIDNIVIIHPPVLCCCWLGIRPVKDTASRATRSSLLASILTWSNPK